MDDGIACDLAQISCRQFPDLSCHAVLLNKRLLCQVDLQIELIHKFLSTGQFFLDNPYNHQAVGETPGADIKVPFGSTFRLLQETLGGCS